MARVRKLDMLARLDLLAAAHEKEIKRRRATAHNFGAMVEDSAIFSKTSRGGLWSRISRRGKVTHSWELDD